MPCVCQPHPIIKWLILCMVSTLIACHSVPSIHVVRDKSANMPQYRTFAFHPSLDREGEQYESLSEQYLKSAIQEELKKRGLAYSDSPDLWVNFNVHTTEKLRVRTKPSPTHYYEFRYGYRVWPGYPIFEERIEQYTEGTLNIDLVDRQKNQLVWEGIAIGKVSKKTLDNLESNIIQTVALIFEKYP